MHAITPAHLDDWLRQHTVPGRPAPIVLDVREPAELQTACVSADGFELRHMPMRSVPARLHELERDHPIACLCHHGGRSAQVTQFLLNQGFTQVVNIHGGIDAWALQRDPSIPRY
ncbi:MAG: sulfurtransferase [Hydrogenophaga sp.]|uniref:rhodanese-like domain-containing protein n=1 Tax=Hydrogenophaga sp. TaxID=1904254 RepID=UPI001DF413A6|nr:rhodanese-like domain-containing protein [Hydrogenophaga sp.]MBX3610048.1 sulfurtransferase [Hydrogenophaga sp.]